jgi:salicylate hydroxylase
MQVAIVGGGIGGLVAASALHAHGIEADVYEQAGELREVGAAVALSANGVRELQRLGFGDDLAAIATQPSSLCIRRGDDGTLICRDPIGDGDTYATAFGAPYYGVHRVPLLRLLATRVDPERVHLARRVIDATAEGRLRFADGAERGADVVIAADGVHSVVRRALRFDCDAVFSQTIGYRGLVPVDALPALPEPAAIQFWAGPGAHLLHYPIDGGRIINFLAVVCVAEWEGEAWMQECDPGESAERFTGWHPAVREMVGAVSQSARWALHDHMPLRQWNAGRVVLLGDAAHAMLPHQGQGANQTIEDAVALATHLAAAGDAGLATALEGYTRQRRDRTARVQAYSRRAVDLLHAAQADVAARDAAFADLPADLAWIHGHDASATAEDRLRTKKEPLMSDGVDHR